MPLVAFTLTWREDCKLGQCCGHRSCAHTLQHASTVACLAFAFALAVEGAPAPDAEAVNRSRLLVVAQMCLKRMEEAHGWLLHSILD